LTNKLNLQNEDDLLKPKKTPPELQKIFREAARIAGPWPPNMSLVIYPLDGSWRIIVSYSDARQQPFRDKLMDLGCQLRELYDLDEEWRAPPLQQPRRSVSAGDPEPNDRRGHRSKKTTKPASK
jgi:hypothetical protein